MRQMRGFSLAFSGLFTLALVMKTYYDIVHKDQHAKAKAFLGTVLHTG